LPAKFVAAYYKARVRRSENGVQRIADWCNFTTGDLAGMGTMFLEHNSKICGLILTMLAVSCSHTSVAEEHSETNPLLDDKWSVRVGVFFPDRNMDFKLKGSTPGQVTQIDFSEQFRLASQKETASLEVEWQFGEIWSFRGQYFEFSDGKSATLDEDVQWGDYTFNAGSGVSGGTSTSITRIFFGRQFAQSDDSEFGIGAGLHLLRLDAFIKGVAYIDGVNVGTRKEAADTTGPLPNFGTWYTKAFSPQLSFTGRLDWLSANVDKYSGRIINASVGLNYAFTDHLGAGLNYNFFELDIGVKDSNWKGDVIMQLDGPYVYLNAYW
jgi:hypothetical protein